MPEKPLSIVVKGRVRVTNQNSAYRNHLGQVMRIDEDDTIWVRIDGHERNGTTPFRRKDLCVSTQESEIEYDAYREIQALQAAADNEDH